MAESVESIAELVERVRKNSILARASRPARERPTRVIESESGQVLLVEWSCPECNGRPSPNTGCKLCRGFGVIDGVRKAIYEEFRSS